MNFRNVYVVGGSLGYARWLNARIVNNIEEADLVMFTGGEDINPKLYNEPVHPQTYFSSRDNHEVVMFKKAVELGIPIIGICRGAQLACALSGGRLIQHQHHPGMHPMITADNQVFLINSLHHQALFPFEMDPNSYEILAWANGLSKIHEDGNKNEMYTPELIRKLGGVIECEVVYFKNTNSLGIQCHPEMLAYYKHQKGIKDTMNYFEYLVDTKIPAVAEITY